MTFVRRLKCNVEGESFETNRDKVQRHTPDTFIHQSKGGEEIVWCLFFLVARPQRSNGLLRGAVLRQLEHCG